MHILGSLLLASQPTVKKVEDDGFLPGILDSKFRTDFKFFQNGAPFKLLSKYNSLFKRGRGVSEIFMLFKMLNKTLKIFLMSEKPRDIKIYKMWVGKIKGGLSQYILGLMKFKFNRGAHLLKLKQYREDQLAPAQAGQADYLRIYFFYIYVIKMVLRLLLASYGRRVLFIQEWM